MEAIPAPSEFDPYFTTDEDREAVGALEATALFLDGAASEPVMWRWVITALHGAVQGFMVIALQGSDGLGAYDQRSMNRRLAARQAHREAMSQGDAEAAHKAEQAMLFGRVRLAEFLELYERIKTDDWPMMQFMNSERYRPRPTDDRCVNDLNSLRNDFIHFKPMLVGMLLTRFPAMTETGLHIIDALLHESNNILWTKGRDPYGLMERSETALARSFEILDGINANYVDLPRPKLPLCGAE